MCSPPSPGKPSWSDTTSKHHQVLSWNNGPTASQRLVGRLLRRKFNRCWSWGWSNHHAARGPAQSFWSQNQMAPSASAMTFDASTKSRSSTATQCPEWTSFWIAWEGPGIFPHWTWQKATGRYPSRTVPNRRQLFQPQAATGNTGSFPSFQRLMDIVLRPHQQYAAAYLDDVVVHSERWEDHLDRLRRVLMELRRAGLAANPRKCHLALFEAKYLGFRVGRGLIKPQEKKVEAIRAAPRPSTKTQVRAFLRLAGYYRCFIPKFSSLAAPLTDLTRKGQPECVIWSPETEEERVLRAPDFSCPFLLQTDASDAGLEAVLSQGKQGEEHPVLFISRKLTKAERNYATVEKEALAVKWAVLELRYYLLGRKFTLLTDHAPLQWMARAKDTNARVTRWFLALQDFYFVEPEPPTLSVLVSLRRSVRGHSPPTPDRPHLRLVCPRPDKPCEAG